MKNIVLKAPLFRSESSNSAHQIKEKSHDNADLASIEEIKQNPVNIIAIEKSKSKDLGGAKKFGGLLSVNDKIGKKRAEYKRRSNSQCSNISGGSPKSGGRGSKRNNKSDH